MTRACSFEKSGLILVHFTANLEAIGSQAFTDCVKLTTADMAFDQSVLSCFKDALELPT